MKTKEELKNTYIEINGNEKLSRAVQEKLFEMGFKWITGENIFYNTTYKFICINETFQLYHTNYENYRTISQIFPSDLGLTDDLKLNMKTIETIDGNKYRFTEEQLEAAKVVDKFNWDLFKEDTVERFDKIGSESDLYIQEYLQARCLSLWNKRAIEDNGGSTVDWGDGNEEKVYPTIDYSKKGYIRIDINVSFSSNKFCGEEHLNETKCREAIDYFGIYFMKCLLGVKD